MRNIPAMPRRSNIERYLKSIELTGATECNNFNINAAFSTCELSTVTVVDFPQDLLLNEQSCLLLLAKFLTVIKKRRQH